MGGAVTAARFRYLGVNVDVARLYDQLLRGRLVEDTARTGVIPTTQLGFQARRGCIDALFIVNSARSRMLVQGQPLLTVFIDAEMAYPSVDHEVLLAQLLRCGVRGRMWCAVRAVLLKGNGVHQCLATWTGASTQTDTGARCVVTPRQWRHWQAYKDACGRCSTLYETVACSNRSSGRRGDRRETLRRRKAS